MCRMMKPRHPSHGSMNSQEDETPIEEEEDGEKTTSKNDEVSGSQSSSNKRKLSPDKAYSEEKRQHLDNTSLDDFLFN